MMAYPVREPEESYALGDLVEHDEQFYKAIERVTGIEPEPREDNHGPSRWLGRYAPL